MKILVIGPYKSPIIQRLVKSLKERGHTVWLASHGNKDEDGLINLGTLYRFSDYLKFRKINHIVEKYNPDVVHAHVLNHYGIMAVAQPKPLVVALWGSDVMLAPHQGNYLKRLAYSILNLIVLKRANKCHTSGAHVAEQANKQYKGSMDKTKVFYWGFPLEKPNEIEERKISVNLNQEFGLKEGVRYVVFPRGLGAVYAPALAAKIINKLKSNVQSLKQIVVLKGFASEKDEQNFKELLDLDQITYIDRLLSSSELYWLYERTAVHVSVPLSDSLGGGVVEPAQLGSFPVLSDLPSYRDYSEKNPAHIIISSNEEDVDEAVNVISQKLMSCEKEKISTVYSNGSVVEMFELLYSEAISICKHR